MRRWLFLICTLCLTACATQPGYWQRPNRADLNVSKDDLECQALASQATQGAGSWASVAPVHASIKNQAKQQAYRQCLQSRGYVWVSPR